MAFGDFTVDRNSAKYVLGSGGDIISYATDEPAFEFNADGSYKGLLVEPAATNICKQSEDINTTWVTTGGNATPTQDTEETPDGDDSSKFIKLADNNTGGGATGVVYVSQTITVVGGAQYTASVFLKKDGLDWGYLTANQAGSAGNASPDQFFDLENGVLGTANAGTDDATIEEYPNGWYRCSITWTQGAGDTSFNFRIFVAEADNDVIVDRDGTSSIFVWGAQVETGPIATSYIPTTTASVTRVKDDITQTGAQSLIGQTEGTLYIEVDWQSTDTFQSLLGISVGSNISNRIYLEKNPADLRALAVIGGSAIVQLDQSASGYSGIQKIAFAYKTNDFEFYRNGSSIDDSTSGSLATMPTLTDIDLGQRADDFFQANMHIRAVALFTRRLSDAECIALTTL